MAGGQMGGTGALTFDIWPSAARSPTSGSRLASAPSREEIEKVSRARSRFHDASARRASEPSRPARERAPTGLDADMQRRAAHATEIMSLLVRASRLGLSRETDRWAGRGEPIEERYQIEWPTGQ